MENQCEATGLKVIEAARSLNRGRCPLCEQLYDLDETGKLPPHERAHKLSPEAVQARLEVAVLAINDAVPDAP